MSFAVVSLPDEDDSALIISTNWLTSTENLCFLPPVVTEIAKKKLILSHEKPECNWKIIKVTVLGKFGTYETAQSYLNAQQTSSPNSTRTTVSVSTGVGKRPRKIRKIVLPGESLSSDDELDNIKKFLTTPYSQSSDSNSIASISNLSSPNNKRPIETTPTFCSRQSSINLTPCSVQLSPILKSPASQTLPKPNQTQTLPTLNNQTQTLPAILNQTPPTLINQTQTLPTVLNQTQSPPKLTNQTKTPPILTNQTPISSTPRHTQIPPTHKNLTTQAPTTTKPPSQTELSSLPLNEFSTFNKSTYESKLNGLLHQDLVTQVASSCSSGDLSQPLQVEVNSTMGDVSLFSPTPSSPGSNSSSSTSIKSEILSLRRGQEMMWGVLGEFSQKLDSILKSLERIENSNPGPEGNAKNGWPIENPWLMNNLPLGKNNFLEFEEKLQDFHFKQQVIGFLRYVGASTVKKLAGKLLKKLISDSLAEEYSLTGKNSKLKNKAFCKTRTYLVVCQVCLLKFEDGEEKQLREGVCDWLSQARHRILKRGHRALDSSSSSFREKLQSFCDLNE